MTQYKKKITVPEGVLEQKLEDEIVFLNMNTQYYHGLDEVGTRILSLLKEHGDVDATVSALLSEFDVEESVLRKDIDDMIEKLRERGLIVVDE